MRNTASERIFGKPQHIPVFLDGGVNLSKPQGWQR